MESLRSNRSAALPGLRRQLPVAVLLTTLVLLCASACVSEGLDYKSNCTLSCTKGADGGPQTLKAPVVCCGEHAYPSHPGEEGSACTVDLILSRTKQLCASQNNGYFQCAPADYSCTCDYPSVFPSYDGCN